MIVLGLDQSYQRTGYAVLETDGVPGRERVLETGTFSTDPAATDAARQAQVAREALWIAQRWAPDLVGVEKPYVSRTGQSPQVALRLAGLHAVLVGALAGAGFEVVAVHTATRQAALGIAPRTKRKALKAASKAVVLARYGLDVTDDESDAIGIALGAVVVQRRDARKVAQLALALKPGRKQRRRALPANVLAAMPAEERAALAATRSE